MLVKLVNFNLLCLVLILSVLPGNKASAQELVFNEQQCLLSFGFTSKPSNKKQHLNLSADVEMSLTNTIAIDKSLKATVASNVTCQKLIGANYTGSKAEWAKFFNSALTGLLKAGFKELQLTLVGENDKAFNSPLTKTLIAKEYMFTGENAGNKQIIKNLALLDKANNTLYTFSVSGNIMTKKDIVKEYKRLLDSIKPIK